MILIVDDHADIGKAMVRLLKHAGHEAAWLSSGPELLAALQSCECSLVVLDMHMPEMDGLQTLQAIKDNDALRGVRVVMCSADEGRELRADALRLGALECLSKGDHVTETLIPRITALAAAG